MPRSEPGPQPIGCAAAVPLRPDGSVIADACGRTAVAGHLRLRRRHRHRPLDRRRGPGSCRRARDRRPRPAVRGRPLLLVRPARPSPPAHRRRTERRVGRARRRPRLAGGSLSRPVRSARGCAARQPPSPGRRASPRAGLDATGPLRSLMDAENPPAGISALHDACRAEDKHALDVERTRPRDA